MKVDKKLLGENIRKVREKHGMSPAQLAESLGKSESTIYDYETGRTLPPFEVLIQIGELFNDDICDIMNVRASECNINSLREMYLLYSSMEKGEEESDFEEER